MAAQQPFGGPMRPVFPPAIEGPSPAWGQGPFGSQIGGYHQAARLRASGRNEMVMHYDPHSTKTSTSGNLRITPHFPTFFRYMKSTTTSWNEAEAVQFLYQSVTMEIRDRLQAYEKDWVPQPGEVRMQYLLAKLKEESAWAGNEDINHEQAFENLRMTGTFSQFLESWTDLRYRIRKARADEPLKTGAAVRNHVLTRVTTELRDTWINRYFSKWADDELEEKKFWKTIKDVQKKAPELKPFPHVSFQQAAFQTFAEDRPRNTPVRTRELTPGPPRMSDQRCYTCGSPSHIKRDCPLRRNSQSRSPGRGYNRSDVSPPRQGGNWSTEDRPRGRRRSRDRSGTREGSGGRTEGYAPTDKYAQLDERMDRMERRMEKMLSRAEATFQRREANQPEPTRPRPDRQTPGGSFQQTRPALEAEGNNPQGPTDAPGVPGVGGSEHVWIPN